MKAYTDSSAERVMVSHAEAQTTDIGKQRDWIRRYQDEVLSRL